MLGIVMGAARCFKPMDWIGFVPYSSRLRAFIQKHECAMFCGKTPVVFGRPA
jgi:hypothetical protein